MRIPAWSMALVGAGVVGSVVMLVQQNWLAGLILLAGSLGLGFFRSIRHTQSQVSANDIFDISAEGRIMLKPFRSFQEDLEPILARSKDNVAVKVIAGEAIEESKKLYDVALRLVRARDQMKKLLYVASELRVKLSKLEEQYPDAEPGSEEELQKQAYRAELAEFDVVEARIADLDRKLKEGQMALSSLKSEVAVNASNSIKADFDQEDVSRIVLDLKALEQSFLDSETILNKAELRNE